MRRVYSPSRVRIWWRLLLGRRCRNLWKWDSNVSPKLIQSTMKRLALAISLIATSASAQLVTNKAEIVSSAGSQSVTNIVEVHEADGSVHTDQRIITAKYQQGHVIAVIDGLEYGWPVRFSLVVSTNIIAGPTTQALVNLLSVPPTVPPPLPK